MGTRTTLHWCVCVCLCVLGRALGWGDAFLSCVLFPPQPPCELVQLSTSLIHHFRGSKYFGSRAAIDPENTTSSLSSSSSSISLLPHVSIFIFSLSLSRFYFTFPNPRLHFGLFHLIAPFHSPVILQCATRTSKRDLVGVH